MCRVTERVVPDVTAVTRWTTFKASKDSHTRALAYDLHESAKGECLGDYGSLDVDADPHPRPASGRGLPDKEGASLLTGQVRESNLEYSDF